MDALNLANASKTTARRALDFYPTPPEVTHALMRFLNLKDIHLAWEPACGDGSMSDVIKEYVPEVYSSDIENRGYGDEGIDFLTCGYHCDAIITNPPFNLSEEFIKHALAHSDTVCMLLKSQYWHAKKRTKLFKDHPPAYVLPLNWRPDFLYKEQCKSGAPTMEVHWTVWLNGASQTQYCILEKPEYSE